MRYMIVTYDETGLPTKSYDMFEVLGRFLTEEGLNCGLADMHAPSEVMEYVSPNRGLLEKLLVSVDIIEDEMTYFDLEDARQAVQDELATMRALIEEQMNLDPFYNDDPIVRYEAEEIPSETPIAIVGE